MPALTKQDRHFVNFVKKITKGGDDVDIIKTTLEDNGFCYFDEGSYRIIYVHKEYPKYVVKVGTEKWIRHGIKKGFKHPLILPILYSGKFVLVQRRAKRIEDKEPPTRRVKQIIKELQSCNVGDVHNYNIGKLGRRLVVFDYWHGDKGWRGGKLTC